MQVGGGRKSSALAHHSQYHITSYSPSTLVTGKKMQFPDITSLLFKKWVAEIIQFCRP